MRRVPRFLHAVLLYSTLLLAFSLSCRVTSVLDNGTVPTMTVAQASGESPTPTHIPTVSPVPTTAEDLTSPRGVLKAYYEALMEERFEQAAAYITSFSLDWNGVEREDIVLFLEQAVFDREWELLDYRIAELEEGEELAVARVWTKEGWLENGARQQDTYEYIFVLALQAEGTWGINYDRLVDVYECDIQPQEHQGLHVRPLYIIRKWTDTVVAFEVVNTTSSPARWGWVSGELAAVETDAGKVWSYNESGFQVMGNRQYSSAYFQLGEMIEGEPTRLTMSGWLWLNERGLPSSGERWGYEFDLREGCTHQTAGSAR